MKLSEKFKELTENQSNEGKSKWRGLTYDELISVLDDVDGKLAPLGAYASDKRIDDKSKLKKLQKLIKEFVIAFK